MTAYWDYDESTNEVILYQNADGTGEVGRTDAGPDGIAWNEDQDFNQYPAQVDDILLSIFNTALANNNNQNALEAARVAIFNDIEKLGN